MKVIMFGDLIELNKSAESYKSKLKTEYTSLRKRTKITLTFFSVIMLSTLFLGIASFIILHNKILSAILVVCAVVVFFIVIRNIRTLRDMKICLEDIDKNGMNSVYYSFGKRLEVLEALNNGNVVGVELFDRNICIAAEVHIKDISDVEKTITIPNLLYKALTDETLSDCIKIDINNRLLMYYFKDKLPFNQMLEVDTVKKENT